MRSSRSLGGVCAKLTAPASWAAPTATRATKPKLRVMAASIAGVCGSIELYARQYHDRSPVLRFVTNSRGNPNFLPAPSLLRLEFKSGDFKPGLIAPSSLSTTRLAEQRGEGDVARRRYRGPKLRGWPPSRPAQLGMRSTGLIVVPCEESCAARLISASG